MGTINAPFGLRLTGRLDNGSLEVFRQYPIASGYNTNIAAGDVVFLDDDGTSTNIEKQTGTGDTVTALEMVGVFVGCSYTDPGTGQPTYSNMWPAGTAASDAMAYVVDDPQALYVVQADEAFTNAGDVYGKNAALVQTAPNTTFKASRVALDASTLGNNANLPIRIVDYVGGARGGEAGTAYPLMVVKLNYTQFTTTTGS
jgi:hypothetical protein